MKKLLIIPIMLICVVCLSTKNMEVVKPRWKKLTKDKLQYHPDVKVEQLDSLLKKL